MYIMTPSEGGEGMFFKYHILCDSFLHIPIYMLIISDHYCSVIPPLLQEQQILNPQQPNQT